MNAIIDKVVRSLVSQGSICEEDSELYHFGIEQLYLFFVNIVTTILIGVIMGMIWQSILFMLAYIPLRKFAGGYHAKTPMRCYCMSVALIVAVLLLIHFVVPSVLVITLIWIASMVVIYLKAPVGSINKPLSEGEKALFRKVALIIAAGESICMLVAFVNSWDMVGECFLISIITAAVMLAIATEKKSVIGIAS